jgi:ABC-type transport system substrate-binding protein
MSGDNRKFRRITRREFMELMALASGGAVLAGCGTPTPLVEEVPELLPTPTKAPTVAPLVEPTKAAATATAEPTEDPESKKYGGIYRCIGGDLPTLDGPTCNYFDWWLANAVIYNRLIDLDPESKPYVDLAEDWPEVSEDGLVYRFKLKKGILFHNGREVKAEDVKFTIDHNFMAGVYTCGIAYLRNIEGAAEVMAMEKPPDFVDLPGTVAVDDYTLEVRLTQPYSIMPLIFTDNTINVIPKQECLDAGADWGTKVVIGTGPFKMVEWIAGEKVTFERNPDYHKPGLPYLDGIEMYLNLDPAAQILQFENREVEFMKDVDVETAKRYLKDEVFKDDVRYSDAAWFDYMDMALNVEPFNDVRMRQAFSMLIDQEAITRTSAGSLVPWASFLTPLILQYNPDFQYKWGFNPTEAEKIVKELYPNGVDVTLWGWNENAMQIIQADAANAGINIEISTKEYGVALEDIKSGAIQLSWRSWMYGLPDGQNFLEPEDRVGYCDPEDQTRWPSRGECDETQNELFMQMYTLPVASPERTQVIQDFEEYLMNEKLQMVLSFMHKSLDLYAQYVQDCPTGKIVTFPILERAWIDKEMYDSIKEIKPAS